MTPAMASEPYCEEAPSRSTSMRLIASPGTRLRSTAALPRPTVPLMLSSADTWRRFPLISTSVWSGLSPRSVAGRSASEPSAMAGWGKLNEGTSWLRILLVSVAPVLVMASVPMTSIGTGESATVRSVRRVPVTMMVLAGSGSASAVTGGSGAGACCAATGAAKAMADSPASKVDRVRCVMAIPLILP